MMTGHQWGLFAAAFLGSMVEWVEAYTIVLAVAITVGWRKASSAAISGLVTIALLVALSGGVMRLGMDLQWLRLFIGVLLLLFGLRWLAKAVARANGRIALHDEAKEFLETQEALSKSDHQAAWLMAFKGVLLEGLEVWLIIFALGSNKAQFLPVTVGAVLGLLAVIAMGFLIRKPLTRIPENAIKFVVGSALLSFGTFWTAEGMGGARAWPLSDWSLLILFAVYAGGGLVLAQMLPIKEQKPGMEV